MKIFKLTLTLLLVVTLNFSCSSTKRAHKLPVEKETTLAFTKPYFQVWNAAIKYGSRGAKLYLPNLQSRTNAKIDKVYFRGMYGTLKKGRSLFTAIVTKPVLNDGSPNPNVEQIEFPFDLRPDECVVSYIEEGKTKYFLISGLAEREGIYYPDGPPTVVSRE